MPKGRLHELTSTLSSWFEDRIPYVYTTNEISALLEEKRVEWKIPTYISSDRFLRFLLENTALEQLLIQSTGERDQPDLTRYIWSRSDPFLLGTSLKQRSYCSHSSALVLHGLTDQLPQTFFVTTPQSRTYPTDKDELVQEAVDKVFAKQQRESQTAYRALGYRYVLLEGAFAQPGDVDEVTLESSRMPVAVSSLERTLIDIVVRPSYSGGIVQVLEAYKAAYGQIDIGRMNLLLNRLNYTYPYQQSIGFLLSKAGYADSEIEPFLEDVTPIHFYLAYGLAEKVFVPKWHLYVPRGFE
jgi:hypothetical protein